MQQETIRLHSGKYWRMLLLYFTAAAVCVPVGRMVYSLYRESFTNPEIDRAGGILLIPLAIVFLSFAGLFVWWLMRRVRGKECFSITPEGLRDVYSFGNFLIVYYCTGTKLIPWDAITSFQLAKHGTRDYVVLQLDERRLPPETSWLFRLHLKGQIMGTLGGLYFGSRSAAGTPQELLEKLNRAKAAYADK